jgi:hypothetical protein
MSRERDEFEGIDISGPWGGVRIGSGGFRSDEWDDDAEVRQIRRRVRQRLDFLKNLCFFAVIVGGLALLDWATGGGWWVQWLAIIWGAFLAVQFMSMFIAPMLWGREAEERMVQAELGRRRRQARVENPAATHGEDT